MQTRKSHRKSRLGCKTCKQRKVKCDERQPTCARCDASGRTCSYLNVPSYLVPSRSTSHTDLRHEAAIEPQRRSPAIADLRPQLDVDDALDVTERYSLLHIGLLDHFKHRLVGEATSLCPDTISIFDTALREAYRTFYLMDQLLALAAAHKSTLSEQGREWYRNEALRLQTRALGRFSQPGNHKSSLARFAFSTFLGQHVLFDAFASASDLPTTLDNLAQCLELHKGIGVVAGEMVAGPASLREDHMANSPKDAHGEMISGSECKGLTELLRASDVSQATVNIYLEATKILQYLFDSVNKSKDRRISAVQEWLVRVSGDYIALLKQRRPEALIVLAYYGVLLHYAKGYWAFSGSGSFLIKGISSHLGDYWSRWLDWPNTQISNETNRTFWSVMSAS